MVGWTGNLLPLMVCGWGLYVVDIGGGIWAESREVRHSIPVDSAPVVAEPHADTTSRINLNEKIPGPNSIPRLQLWLKADSPSFDDSLTATEIDWFTADTTAIVVPTSGAVSGNDQIEAYRVDPVVHQTPFSPATGTGKSTVCVVTTTEGDEWKGLQGERPTRQISEILVFNHGLSEVDRIVLYEYMELHYRQTSPRLVAPLWRVINSRLSREAMRLLNDSELR